MAIKRKRGHIPTSLRFELWAMACVICGDKGDIEIDHIIPVLQGGTSDRSNLQPLCFQCHRRKGNKLGRSNDELRELYLANKVEHHLRNRYRFETRFDNSFDRASYTEWRRVNA